MGLLQFLPLLAATVVLAAGQSCPTAPFVDHSGQVTAECIGGNYRLSCGNAPIRVFINNVGVAYDKVIAVDGNWYGLMCEDGVTPLTSPPTVSCSTSQCAYDCPYVNRGGADLAASCKNGNTLRTCDAGDFYIDNTIYKAAECTPQGKWIAWNCDNMSIIDGPLIGGCSKWECSWLHFLEQEMISSSTLHGVALDASQKPVFVDEVLTFKCGPGTNLAHKPKTGTEVIVNDWWLSCAAPNFWSVKRPGLSDATYDSPHVGCVKPSCTGMGYFSGSEPILAANPSYELVSTVTTYTQNKRFEIVCPAGAGIGYVTSSGAFTFSLTLGVRCENAGWMITGTSNMFTGKTVGCFRQV